MKKLWAEGKLGRHVRKIAPQSNASTDSVDSLLSGMDMLNKARSNIQELTQQLGTIAIIDSIADFKKTVIRGMGFLGLLWSVGIVILAFVR